jgi:valyl-tRNA synthetase
MWSHLDYEATSGGVYSLVATEIATGCSSEIVSATVIQSAPAVVTFTVSNAFAENQTITVTTNAYQGSQYVYQLDQGPIQESGVFENVSPGPHQVTVYDLAGCESVTIEVEAINYPQFFTPNGDGFNDTWNIIGLDNQPNAKIYIFDRYGKLLKQISAAGQGWDGTFNGQPAPSTDYWFTVDYFEEAQIKTFKANFTLKR